MATEMVQHAGRKRTRWIPDNGFKVTEKNGYAVVHVYHGAVSGKLTAIAYTGNAAKAAWHYTYRTEKELSAKITSYFAGLVSWKQRKASYRSEANQGHSFKVGDIVTNSWGYNQTNVDWYRVAKTSKCFVWLQPIAAHVEETGFMSGSTAPHIDTTSEHPEQWGFRNGSGKVEQHKASGDHVTFQFGSGSKWKGESQYCSWYA